MHPIGVGKDIDRADGGKAARQRNGVRIFVEDAAKDLTKGFEVSVEFDDAFRCFIKFFCGNFPEFVFGEDSFQLELV